MSSGSSACSEVGAPAVPRGPVDPLHSTCVVSDGRDDAEVAVDGASLPVYTPGSSLTRVTVFTAYVRDNKLDPARFQLNNDWTARAARTGGRR